jgi:hypothetical protein
MSACECGERPDPGMCGGECPVFRRLGRHGCRCVHWAQHQPPLPRKNWWDEAISPSARSEPVRPIRLGSCCAMVGNPECRCEVKTNWGLTEAPPYWVRPVWW